MKKLITILVILAVLLILFLMMGPFYVVEEGTFALVVRFGRIQEEVTQAGLHFKAPFIDNVVVYSKKIRSWDGEPQRIQTKENQFIYVDATARWRIVNPKLFYETLTTMPEAYNKLNNFIDSSVRTVISGNFLREAVRNSNMINTSTTRESFETGDVEGSDSLRQLTQTETNQELVAKGRRQLFMNILGLSQQQLGQFGIEVIDVIPRQIRYSEELTASVYERMIKERNQIAQAFRSFGEGRKEEWIGRQDNDMRAILSEAYREAETIKGVADASASRIYADSYSRDPDFFAFWRAIESYRQTMPRFTKTLSTSAEYFDFLFSPNGR
ncbi:MAG: HflC protein [Spirochaetes bacterium GWD1_61_31]|nr:MAG: HflC protein [Spirochaetes bacterium GWB1_60_80]OHD29660.1 MAG: HflC protein [Spirochaetes bacterium GWC1_61_12]OHD34693.1 MAG: HflC protein [Spirochaetes bacterium GWD1_61_31]OHD41925.1 MAG: HflC protein [Spirochaetes bacterium GWE1_60_18]OHD61809.1 MAG: HflC protein [Spirochaetes bacterium GWF1_60_12]HAW85168.1 protease modulator HflC [Spirochaetaceae bacterium]